MTIVKDLSCGFVALMLCSGAAFASEGAAALTSPSEIILVQEPSKVVPRVLDKSNLDNTSLVVSIPRQRVTLIVNGEVAIDAPVSTGKRRGVTPPGEYTIIAKSATHSSNMHGDFVDAAGRVLRSGVSTRIDSAPSGTTFREVPVKYFMRLTPEGLALHSGSLPGFPASDTSVRLPEEVAPLIFQRVKTDTPVRIEE